MSSLNTNAMTRYRPSSGASAQRLETLLVSILSHIRSGQLTLTLPSGRTHVIRASQQQPAENAPQALWKLHSYKGLRRILRSKSIGFAEGYIHGDWSTTDLASFMEIIAADMDALEARIENWPLVRAYNRLQHFLRRNTKRGSRRNISYHYDLGNDFYGLWLDPTMTYSSALFDERHTDLESAQYNKYRQLADSMDLQPHHQILEIGCGWGGFAEFAARTYGCHVTGITLSTEQLAYARERIRAADLENKVEFRLQDYRDVSEKYDRIVSIEMFEAVGEENWPTYFAQVRNLLTDRGLAGLQIISIANERFENYRNDTDFIQKYIFPGGMLPSSAILGDEINKAGLRLEEQKMFGSSYARTLQLWREAFLGNWATINNLGYSKQFRRMWEYYLCYCEVGFLHGTIDVGHYILANRRQP